VEENPIKYENLNTLINLLFMCQKVHIFIKGLINLNFNKRNGRKYNLNNSCLLFINKEKVN